jgi:3-oxoacyl-[acyl-carrier protein] reductase
MAKNIIITGTSRGIGFELAKNLSDAGHQVLALSRQTSSLDVLNLPNVHVLAFDLARQDDLKQVRNYVKTNWEKVDVLIHNAGAICNKPFLKTTSEDFLTVYQTNVFGVATLTQAVIPFMNSSGHVVVLSSMGGVQGSSKFPGLAAYSSSKGAVITLVELLAEEFKTSGPSFNALALGAVQTEMLETAFPGYQAPVTAAEMATYIADFALTGQELFNGKLIPVSKSTP